MITTITEEIVGASAFLAPSGGDDTPEFLNALTNFAPFVTPMIQLGVGTFQVTHITATSSFELVGSGDATIIKQTAATNNHLFSCTTNGLTLRFRNLKIDSNHANQTDDSSHVWNAIFVNADAASATTPFRVEITDCTFINGRQADVALTKGTAQSATSKFLLTITSSRFYGGAETSATDQTYGAKYVQMSGALNGTITGSTFDLQNTPQQNGRAGVTLDCSVGTGSLTMLGNQFQNVGLSQTAALGAIDIYAGGLDAILSDNRIVNPNGRGIDIKCDSSNVAIIGNTIDGLTGSTQDAQIVVNALVHNTVGGNVTINGNTCRNSGNDGISLIGNGTGGNAGPYNVCGNTIIGATRRAIGVLNCGDVKADDNTISGGAGDGIYLDANVGHVSVCDNTVTSCGSNAIEWQINNTGTLKCDGNDITSPTNRGIYIAAGAGGSASHNTLNNCGNTAMQVQGTTGAFLVSGNHAYGTNATFSNGGANTALWVDETNRFATALSAAARTLTLDVSGTATAWTNLHLIDTNAGGASQNMVTLNGVPDGQMVTLRPANLAHVVTVTTGGNLQMNASKALSLSTNTVTLIAQGANLYEVGVI